MSTASSSSKPSKGWQPPTLEEMQAMLPQYEFISLLGRGGMGAVYKALQTSLHRSVAIKVLPEDLIDDLEANFAERFRNEARTMAKMSHPGIVKVFDFGKAQTGLLYIVMEFIDGTDVSKMIQSQGKLPQDYALAITAHVGDALAYAHKNGVIHRDIKPANILINQEGTVKVADFGLAKINDSNLRGLTKTNMAMGTPDFVAPEALSPGTVVDGRADLYAMGVMLYQMLTGEVPRGMWSMPSIKVGTDPRFDSVILKAMQTDRELRYQDATEIRHDLDVIMTQPFVKEEPKPAPAPAPAPAQQPVAGKPNGGQPQAESPASRSMPQGQAQTPARPVKKKSNDALIYLVAVVLIGALVGLFVLSGGAKSSKSLPSVAGGDAGQTDRATPPLAAPPPTGEAARVPVASSAHVAPAAAAPASGGAWQPLFTNEMKRNPDIDVLQDGWLLAKKNLVAPSGRDIAMRVKTRLGKSDYIWPLIVHDKPVRGLSHYGVRVTKNQIFLHLRDMVEGKYTPKDKELKSSPLPRTLGGNDEFDLEITCRGDQITVAFDGKTLIDVRNSFCTGSHNLFAGELKNLEWRDLSPVSVKSSTATTPASSQPASPPAAVSTTGVSLAERQKSLAAPLPPGVTDLLPTLSLNSDNTFSWTKTATGLELKALKAPGPYKSCVDFPVVASSDYVIEAWFTNSVEGSDDVGLTIPVGDQRRTTCWFWTRDGGWAGFGKVDGHDPQQPTIEKGCSTPFQLIPGELTFVRTEVRRSSDNVDLRFMINGRLMGAYRGPTSRLHTSTAWLVGRDPEQASIGGRAVTFHRVTVQPLGLEAEKKPVVAIAAIPADPRLAQLDASFKARYESDAQKPYLAAVAALNQSYVSKGIARAQTQANGRSDEVSALDAEKSAIEKGAGVPAEDAAGTPDSLKTLRITYRTELAKIEADRTKAVAPLYDIYLKALDAYIIELTRADKIKQAQDVQTFRGKIAQQKQQAAPPVP